MQREPTRTAALRSCPVDLRLAQVALAAGIIGPDLYSALIVMTLVTALAAPPIMKRLFRKFRLEDILPENPRTATKPATSEDASEEA